MGFKLFDDKIGALSQSGGVITLAPSILTIGGQQYRTGILSLTLPSLITNQLYMIYATVSAGVVSLSVSVNVNSTGPGATAWKLVGAFYSNGTSTFGKFVNTKGAPSCDGISYAPVIKGTTTAPVIATWDTQTGVWRRNGSVMECEAAISPGNITSAGSGPYVFTMPTLFIPLNNGVIYSSSISRWDRSQAVGTASLSSNTATAGWSTLNPTDGTVLIASASDSTYGVVIITHENVVSSGWFALGNFTSYSFKFTVAISGWASTALEDL